MKFIILGAGLSGLTCGATLKRYGHDVSIVEKESVVGGLARSYRVHGYTFDYGPHFLFGDKVFHLIQEQYPSIALKRVESTKEKMFFANKYFNFPFDPKNILLHMDKKYVPGVLLELFIKSMLRQNNSNGSQCVEDWVIQAVGRRIYEYISLGGYVKKLYGLPPTEISDEWGIQKLKFLAKWRDANLIELITKAFSEGGNVKKRFIHYPSGGIDHIPIMISEVFRSLGGEILLNSETVSVGYRKDGVSVTVKKDGEEYQLDGDFLISTIPITHLIRMLSPSPPFEVNNKARLLRYRTLLLLYLCIGKEAALKYGCIYFTEDRFLFRRLTEFKHLDKAMSPEGKTSLCVEITCFENDEIHRMDKDEVSRIVVEQLERGGFILGNDVEGVHLLRIPYAYPVYGINSRLVLDEVMTYLGSLDRLVSIGRQGLFFYNAMNSSIIMGSHLSERLAVTDVSRRKEIIRGVYNDRRRKYTD
ncbi:MAG: FAD-dependent oxidoreductase [Deltaproteobacteria bacterium]|nr:FAD-dependent oxidoreductase [Deltaproteobacteria bacterium]